MSANPSLVTVSAVTIASAVGSNLGQRLQLAIYSTRCYRLYLECMDDDLQDPLV